MRRFLFLGVLCLIAAAAQADRKPYTRNVAVVLYEHTELLDWAGPYEVWTNAAGFAADGEAKAFNVYTVGKTTEPLISQGALKVVPDYSIENAPKPDVVIIPGGHTGMLLDDPAFFAWAKKAAEESELTLTVCTGAFVLAKAGLIDKMEVTTWYGAIESLQKQYPNVTVKDGRRFVDNGKFVTTAGISAGIDGSLHLVARLLGRRVADQVARYMEYHWTPEAYLSVKYPYLNPSTSERGRAMQTADMRREENDLAGAASIYRAVLAKNDSDADAWIALGRTLRGLNDHAAAADAFVRAGTPRALYQAAVSYATADQQERAVETLVKSWGAGFTNREAITSEPALAKVREDARVKALGQ
ncbi:MAG: DJ-1/PfpI family protein [Thermoanaerobaculia bacterium]